MPERHEHSYYEIALTATQMVVAFVLVLACLIAAFFAGVYVGRDGSLPGAVVAQNDTGTEESAAEQGNSGAEAGAQPGAFDFFSEGEPQEAPPAPREIAEEANPSTTLLEDVAGEPRQPLQAEPQAPAQAPVRESQPAARAQPQSQGPAEQQESAPATSDPAAPAPATSAQAGGGLVIQVFSSDSYEQAQQVLERLRGGGMPAFLSPVEVNERTMHRVRVGPYSERARAEEIAQRVRRDYQLDTWITQGE